eukprot:CAMPEP_0176479898 /NCGR_PEP_ID=MMETSP0200_2-20121128/1991_1 /TAXON_ID=947934 /ORGANISM="Chaetoceros sp., Strain GSL56" /LENGTH=598 /DNA_ID=CAMNT_0017875985 /DNA_START=87 /DNA_END=1884 /DNA_ORIENTATION=+
MNKYFKQSSKQGVKGQRLAFVMHHSSPSKLLPYTIKECRLEPHPQFPMGSSLFLPCNNFQESKTSGFLCAVKTDKKKWNLGVLQQTKILGDFKANSYEGYFLLFKKGTSWDVVLSGLEKYSKSKQIQYILKYVDPRKIVVDGHGVIPLVEVSRYLMNQKAIHFHISPKDNCFEQPKEGPQAWWRATGDSFEKLFGEQKTGVLTGDWIRDPTVTLSPIKLPCDDLSDQGTTTSQEEIKLSMLDEKSKRIMLDFSDGLKSAKVIDRKSDNSPVPVYYVKEISASKVASEEKYVLFPYVSTKDHGDTQAFAKISVKKVTGLIKQIKEMTYPEYNDMLNQTRAGASIKLFIINPSKHPRGFAVAVLHDDENPPQGAVEVFSSSSKKIFRENRDGVFHDFQLEVGTVVYRGLPWMFDINIQESDLHFVEHMHGNETRGLPHVRNGVYNFGYFSYTGPRASSQSSASPVEENSYGHDLFTNKYRTPAYPIGLKIGNILCSQSDKMMECSGNTVMKLAMYHNLMTIEDNKNSVYSAICLNRIITEWFASSIHTDRNDKVSTSFQGFVKKICELIPDSLVKFNVPISMKYANILSDTGIALGMNLV